MISKVFAIAVSVVLASALAYAQGQRDQKPMPEQCKNMMAKLNALEMWCYRRMVKISWIDKISNEVVLERLGVQQRWTDIVAQRKLRYAGHILRGSASELHNIILEGMVEGKRDRGRQRSVWMDNIKRWIRVDNFAEAKAMARQRSLWRDRVVNLRIVEEGT